MKPQHFTVIRSMCLLSSQSLPLSGECRSVADDDERRLVMTGSVCLNRLVVETERLSASRDKERKMVRGTVNRLESKTLFQGKLH